MPGKNRSKAVQIGDKGYFWTPTRSEAADLARGSLPDYVDRLHRVVTNQKAKTSEVIAAGRELRLLAYGQDKGRVSGKNETSGKVRAQVAKSASPEELVAKAKAVIARYEKGNDPLGDMGPVGPHTQLPHPLSAQKDPPPPNLQRDPSTTQGGPANLEDALQRPDVLAVSMPLLNSKSLPVGERPTVDHAARMGFCSLGQNVSVSRRLIRILLYPVLVLAACFAVGLFFSFYVAPQFEQMLAEFGIELPKLTLAVLGFAHFLRRWWWAILLLLLGAGVAIWIANRSGRDKIPANSSWIDQRLMSTRNALAAWAWHISLLLELGVSQRQALKEAGKATGNHRLQRVCFARAALSDDEFAECGQPYFDSPKYRLLDRVMQVEPSPGKILLLREVADYYWDRNRNTGDWWIQWLVSAMLCTIGVLILLGVLALFLPLISVVSGLTGVLV